MEKRKFYLHENTCATVKLLPIPGYGWIIPNTQTQVILSLDRKVFTDECSAKTAFLYGGV
jgi:hypothetical protein